MQFLPVWIIAAVAAVQTSSINVRITHSDPVLVRAVIDGDTIDVSAIGRVRLLGIDAPELGRVFDTPAPFAREARERLVSLILNRWVRLEQDGPALDAYSRHLAYVMREDGVFVNAALVGDGLARVSARLPMARLDELKHAEAEAQTFRRGMWGSTPQIPTTSYTRRSNGGRSPSAKTKKPRPSRSKRKPKL